MKKLSIAAGLLCLGMSSIAQLSTQDTSFCMDKNKLDLGDQTNITWEGPGVDQNGFFSSFEAGVGVHKVYGTKNAVKDSIEITVKENVFPDLGHDLSGWHDSYHKFDSKITHQNATFSWKKGNNLLNTKASYHYNDFLQEGELIVFTELPNGCTNSDTVNQSLRAPAQVTFPDFTTCIDGPLFSVSGNYDDSTFFETTWYNSRTWNQIDPNNIEPSILGEGYHHKLYYEVRDSNGVRTYDSVAVNVTGFANIQLSDTTYLEVDDNYLYLPTEYTRGIWTGPGITSPTTPRFHPSIAGIGTHVIYYEDNGGCNSKDSIVIIVTSTTPQIAYFNTTLCPANSALTLSSNIAGNWFVVDAQNQKTALNSNVFDQSMYATGEYSIILETNEGNDTVQIEIESVFQAIIDQNTLSVFNTSGPIQLSASPSGGTWHGMGVNSNTGSFNPKLVALGSNYVVYRANETCSYPDTIEIIVSENPLEDCERNITVSTSTPTLRPGFSTAPYCEIRNHSSKTAYNVRYVMYWDNIVEISDFFAFSEPTIEQKGDSLIAIWDSLPANSTEFFGYRIYTPAGEWNIGIPVSFNDRISHTCEGVNLSNFNSSKIVTIGGSYDPNHKEATIGNGAMSDTTTSLTYTIQFQNTGTDTAFTVVLEDTINPDFFEIESVKMKAGSHTYIFEIDTLNNLLKWTFNNILLVDSMTNEPGSHGSVQFSIDLKENIGYGVKVENEAYIYFDFNSPIITNKAYNFFELPEGITTSREFNDWNARFSTTSNAIEVNINIKSNTTETIHIFDLSGKLIKTVQTDLNNGSNQITIPSGEFSPGLYILQLSQLGSSQPLLIVR